MHKTTLSLILISFFFSCSAQSNEEETVNQSATEDSVKLELDSVDIDFQFRGRCYAFNSAKHNVESNGEAHSSNLAQKTDDSFTKNDNYLFLNTQEYEGSDNNRAAHKLYLVNTTKSKISYSAQDSRLNIVAQALDENGEWKENVLKTFHMGSKCESIWCEYHGMNVQKFGPTCVTLYTYDMLSKKTIGKIKYSDITFIG